MSYLLVGLFALYGIAAFFGAFALAIRGAERRFPYNDERWVLCCGMFWWAAPVLWIFDWVDALRDG